MKLRSYAKINWTLEVLFRRDDGYHEIRTIYQTVSLHDTVCLSESGRGIEVVSDNPDIPSDQRNLAYRAALLAQRITGTSRRVRIDIAKRIPVAAGLGGGSSNAAMTLLGLNSLWDLGLGYQDLVAIAAELGSDVPFFLLGGTALGIGRGEEVYPLEEARCDYLVLANPGLQVSTGEAYDRLSQLTRSGPARMIPFTLLAAKGIREQPLQVKNDFEEVVFDSHRRIGEVKQSLTTIGARQALMSGSGATVYGVFTRLEECERAVIELRKAGLWAEHVRTVSRLECMETRFETGE